MNAKDKLLSVEEFADGLNNKPIMSKTDRRSREAVTELKVMHGPFVHFKHVWSVLANYEQGQRHFWAMICQAVEVWDRKMWVQTFGPHLVHRMAVKLPVTLTSRPNFNASALVKQVVAHRGCLETTFAYNYNGK